MVDSVLDIFLFKQKTAYELRISDWSSDVCSSDLPAALLRGFPRVWAAGWMRACEPAALLRGFPRVWAAGWMRAWRPGSGKRGGDLGQGLASSGPWGRAQRCQPASVIERDQKKM